MTTAVMPDIEAWTKGEIEEPCETWVRYPSRLCGDTAVAVLHMRCVCGRPPMTRLVCAVHLDRAISGEIVCTRACGRRPRITWVERIRGVS